LGFIGAILVARSLFVAGEPIDPIQFRPLSIIAIGVVLFGVLLEPLGLVIALIVVTLVAAFAGRDWRPLEAAGLAVALAAFSVGIFVVALRLPLPIWPSFL
jgi:Tripartite tricarboxylate transporter TctB family